jgi:hypothetical protein
MSIQKLSKKQTESILNSYRDNIMNECIALPVGEAIKILIKDWNASGKEIHPTTFINNKAGIHVKVKAIGLHYIIKKIH